jgi:hypothetical protein
MTRPSNNDFRIAGAFGISPDPTNSNIEEVMTQGIGFPLRPISGVPLTITPELPPDALTKGVPVQWMGGWRSGAFYPQGAFVADGLWTAIATKLTLDNPAPIPDPTDPPTFGLPSYTPATQSDESVVLSTNTAIFSKDGWAKELRVWVPAVGAGISYLVAVTNITDPENPIFTTISLPALNAGQWTDIGQLNKAIKTGDEYLFQLESINSASSSTINGQWTFLGTDQAGAPDTGEWSINEEQNVFRINRIDFNGGDRTFELENVLPTSVISVVQTDNSQNTYEYRVDIVDIKTSYVEYNVTLLEIGNSGPVEDSLTTIDIVVPNASATQYSEEVGGFTVAPNWASSIQGRLSFNGVDQGVPTSNAYGLDILFEPAIVSTDWDIVSYSGE